MTIDPRAPEHPARVASRQPLIPRGAHLTDRLWTGGALPSRPDAATRVIEIWRSVGIGAVVDTRGEWSDEDRVASVAPEVAYLNPGVVDGGQPMRDSWFETITAFAHQHLCAGAGVLVHCHSGINRGPSAAFAVLLSTGWDPVDAIELIRTQRPIATVAYAENALDWWSRSSRLPDGRHAATRARFDRWRRADRAALHARAQQAPES
jgi:dual specificity phosphatase 3